jgi:PKD repeat protein
MKKLFQPKLGFRLLFVAIFSLIVVNFTNGQSVHSNAKDGSLIFKIKDSYNHDYIIDENNFVDLSSMKNLSSFINEYGVTSVTRELTAFNDPSLMRIFFVTFSEIDKVDLFIKELHDVDFIEYAELDLVRRPLWTPNDPYYTGNYKWYLDQINASAAWDIQHGSAAVKVAIVDNAVWGEHEDLGILAANQCNASVNPVQTGTGKSAPPTSVNQNQNCTYNDFNDGYCNSYEWSHGTHCAGLVGAKNNNGKGIASIGGGVTLMGVRCSDNSSADDMYTTSITRGVNWAAQQGAHVINMSLGGTGSSNAEQTQFQNLYNNGICVVAAAGNDGTQVKNYPAAYASVLAVASTDRNKKLSSFSQYGTWVDIAAPGGYYNESTSYVNMLSTTFCTSQYFRITGTSTFNGKYYDGMQGTSMSCPVAAGAVALLKSRNMNATPAQIFNCLKTTSQNLASGSNTIASGSGIIDVAAALNCIGGGSGNPVAQFTANPTSGNSPLSVQFTDQSSAGTGSITTRTWSFPGGNPASSTAQNPSVVYSIPGTYNVTLTVKNSSNASDTETKNGYINVTQAGTSFTLDFESSANFATNFSPWTTVDVDQSPTYGITLDGTSVSFPGVNEPMSFICFNPNATSPAIAGADPHGGQKQGASFAATNPPNNDWLISPKVRPLNNTWKFQVWVRSYTHEYGLERYKIGVSTTGNQASNFTTFLTGASYQQAPTTWTLKEFSLANYVNQDIYIGVNCVSDDAFIFFVDDLFIGGATDINENDLNNEVHIYPNPAQEIVFINFEEAARKNTKINILDMNGRLVHSQIYSEEGVGGTTIDISNISNGLYFVNFIFDDKVVVKKLTIAK